MTNRLLRPTRACEHLFVQNDLDRLGDEIATLAAHLAAATARWLSLIAEFDRRGGFKSCADWLSWRDEFRPSWRSQLENHRPRHAPFAAT